MKIKFLKKGKYKNDIAVIEVVDTNMVYEVHEKNALVYIEKDKAVCMEKSLGNKQVNDIKAVHAKIAEKKAEKKDESKDEKKD